MKSLKLSLFMVMMICAAMAVSESPTESRIHQDENYLQLSTQDGFSIIMDARNGSAIQWQFDQHAIFIEPTSLVQFEEILESPNAPNLLGGMSPQDWGILPENLEKRVNGKQGPWLRVQGGVNHPKRTVSLSQTTAQPLVLSGWCQTDVKADALGWWNRSIALNAIGVYADGKKLPEVSAVFGQYQHGPQFNKCFIYPDRPLSELQLELTALEGDCTAWYRDVRLSPAQYRIIRPDAPLKRIDACVWQYFESPADDLKGWIAFQPLTDCIEIRGVLNSAKSEDRAVSAYVSLPFDAVGGRWHDHFRESRVIESGQTYRDESPQWYYGAGRDGRNSIYPLACVESADGLGLAVATSVGEPRLFQTEYDAHAKALRIRFDLGLSPDGGTYANQATFSARIFKYDVKDGFRGATERYHKMYWWAFDRRVTKGGTWLAFLSPTFIPGNPDDFHFQFIETASNMGWEEQQGMYSLFYTLPWTHVHEFPKHIEAPEVHGTAIPETSLALAKRIPTLEGLPQEMYHRYNAYLGAYPADKWGQPNGFLFRSSKGGRNDNQMLTNPDCELPPPPGAPYSYGGYEREMIREAMGVSQQWHVPGWRMSRVTSHNFFELDPQQAAEGKQSLRFEPVESKNYFEQHLRGLSQDVYLNSTSPQTISFSMRIKSDQDDTGKYAPEFSILFWDQAGKQTKQSFPVSSLTPDWQTLAFEAETPESTAALTIILEFPPYVPNPLRVWLDDMVLTANNGPNLLKNSSFEEAQLLPCKLDGLYLDIIEGYWGNLNYTRNHWLYSEVPLTFDSARAPTLLQVHTHTTFAHQMADWLHPQDMILFGNCTPTTPFTAPYLDVLGDEQFWKQGETWSPKPDKAFNYVHFMSRAKPYNILQYSDLTLDEQTRYMKRCLFYGIFPSNQTDPQGKWYWANPIMVERNRPIYKRLVPFIIEITQAGWQPLTLAQSDNEKVWLERFGDGKTFYLTVFNSDTVTQTAVITLDSRTGLTSKATIEERMADKQIKWSSTKPEHTFSVTLEPEDVAVFCIKNR